MQSHYDILRQKDAETYKWNDRIYKWISIETMSEEFQSLVLFFNLYYSSLNSYWYIFISPAQAVISQKASESLASDFGNQHNTTNSCIFRHVRSIQKK